MGGRHQEVLSRRYEERPVCPTCIANLALIYVAMTVIGAPKKTEDNVYFLAFERGINAGTKA